MRAFAQIGLVAFSFSVFPAHAFALDQADVLALDGVRKFCSGGFATLAQGERAKIIYKKNEVEIAAGNEIFVTNEAGVFTKKIEIDFSEYTKCASEMFELLGLKKN